MSSYKNYSRRSFFKTGMLGTASLGLLGIANGREIATGNLPVENGLKRLPYKIGIRQASLRNPIDPKKNMVANFDALKIARDIPGIIGLELQVATGNPNLYNLDVARRYKAESNKWGMEIPSTAGIWSSKGAWNPDAAEEIIRSIRATELVGASVMLIAFFGGSAPELSDVSFYDRIVKILKEVAPRAKDAGVILGLENSLSPADNKKLLDIIDDPNVQIYYDLENMYNYGHGQEAVPGIKLLGKERIAAVHVKNNGRPISSNWRIDWAHAFQELTDLQYEGWLTFESDHTSHIQCIKETEENIDYIKNHFQPPVC
ncbi:MAG: sugar phosphate isomerase/epimerase [Prolixibacteraceae bacterium]|nr:sugar phosphate isomerase/epimerase [Prolixibacteraceae bacterium]